MFKRIKKLALTLCACGVFILTGAQTTDFVPVKVTFIEEPVEVEPVTVTTSIDDALEIVEEEVVEELPLTREEIELIALVTMAEAEGESETGKRLVIDTILNRVDSEISYFPDTVHEVIYQRNAFSSMWNGRVDRCYVREDICQLVEEELVNRKNNDVVYFTAGKYGKYGTPAFQEGNHYFSKA